MHLILGLEADGVAVPETATAMHAEAGSQVVGPSGLLRVVESRLGLGGPPAQAARRLARWRAKLAAADGPYRFWQRSLSADPFATARLLLEWRDALIAAGWRPSAMSSAGTPPRLHDLALAEEAGPPLPRGEADRVRAAVHALYTDPPLAPIVESLRLLDQREHLPPGLAALVEALVVTGTRVENEPIPATAALGDLGAAQGLLAGLGPSAVSGDGRFLLLEAESEGAAAEVVADLLAAAPWCDSLALLATRPSGVLDAALRRRHLPRLGLADPSPLRGILQALPLALAIRWHPFDPRRLLELLQLPRCPIPREPRRALLRLLPETPGRDGVAWRAAIADSLAALRSRLSAEDPYRAAGRIEDAEAAIAIFLEASPADPERGMPVEDLCRLCAALARWANRQAAAGEPLASALAAHAEALAEAARETGAAALPRLDVERLLDVVQAEGVRDQAAEPEAAAWRLATAPGAVWSAVPRLLWWGFDAPPLPAPSPWTQQEQAALEASGCLPWRPEAALAAASRAWRRPLLAARELVLLVAIRPAGTEAHPLAHELEPLLEPNPALRPRAEALLGAEAPIVAGVALPRVRAGRVLLPMARRSWEAGAPIIVKREVDSASALEQLLGCPFAWALRYAAGLRGGRLAQAAEGERLIGTLGHALAAELLAPGGRVPDPAALEASAQARLPALVAEVAAPLLQPGEARDRARAITALPRAMASIGRLLRDGGLAVVGTETVHAANDLIEPGSRLEGRVDLLLRDRAGRVALLDLKWSRRGARYREAVAEGLAIQLAAYAAMTGAEERAAYLLLAEAGAVGPPGGLSGLAVPQGAPSLAATWTTVLASRAARAAALGAGRLHALGIYEGRKPPPDPDNVPLPVQAPCRFCDAGRVCGKASAA